MPRDGLVDSPRAWAGAVAIAVVNGIAFGTAYTFGAFVDAMADEFGAGRGSTSVMFGVTLLAFFGFGIVSGPLSDRVGPRRLIAVGGALFVAGLLATSQVHSLWLGYLTYGLGAGLGPGVWVAPAMAAIGRLFDRRRALAIGIVATGNGLGTLLLVPLAEYVIDRHGWRDAYVVLAALGAAAVALGVALVRDPPTGGPAPRAAEHLRWAAGLRSFRALFASGLLMSIGLYVALGFIVPFAKDDGVASSTAARLVGIVGLSSIAGRLGFTALSGRLDPVQLYRLSLAVQPVAYVLWLVADGRLAVLVVFCVLLGATYGGFVALGPEVVVHLYGLRGLGALMGALFLSFGLGGLVGPPMAGWLADVTDGHTVPIVAVIVAVALAVALSAAIADGGRRPHSAAE